MSKQKILELHVRDSEIQLHAANAALRESEQKYRAMVEIIPDWVWQVDRNGIYTYSSPKVKDLLGYEPEEVIGKTPFDFMPDAEAEHMRAIFREFVVSHGPIERLENTNVHKDGRLVVLETSAVAIYDENGEFTGYGGVDRDITKRKEAENALIESRQSLAEAQHIAHIGNWDWNVADDKLFWSDEMFSIFGVDPEKFTASYDDFINVVHPADRDFANEEIHAALEGRKPFDAQFRLLLKDGTLKHIEAKGKTFTDGKGRTIRMIGTNQDITKRKHAEEALRLEKDKLQVLADGLGKAGIGIDIVDVNYNILSQNQILMDRFGDLTGKYCYESYMQLAEPCENCPMSKAVASGHIERVELTGADGKDYEILAAPLPNPDGTVDKAIEVVRDITERKQAEKALRESHERFEAIMDSLDSLVYVADFESHELLFVNKYGRNIWGDIVGRKCWQSLQAGKTEPCEFCTNDHLLDENGQATGVYTWEFQNTVNDHWYECHDQAIPWTDGRLVRMEIATDITERKKGETEREQLMDSLAEKSSEMERLLRIVTHDLRSPLVNIIGFSNELETDCQKIVEALNSIEMDEQLKEDISDIANEYIPDSLNFIISSTKKMDSLITSLSQLSQLGRIELHIEAIDMDEMIGEIVKATLYKVKQEGVSITSEHLPDCKGDDKQVNQVFANVIGNAIKYLDPARKGQIKISGQVEGPMSVYCVEDNGVGIPDKHKDKVFEIFHRVDPKSHVAGEGIGLTAAKQMVGRLGGKIRVESEVGVGSKFFIELPAV